jgi:hypothetical protein
MRSLHCGMQAGLHFQMIGNEQVLVLRDVPFEWENIIATWIGSLPTAQVTEGMLDCILRSHPVKGLLNCAET